MRALPLRRARADARAADDAHAARRKYKKDLDHLNPDRAAYNAQKEAALGYAPGALAPGGSADLRVATVSHEQQLAAEHLYRDANSLLYADNKPSEEAIDRVVSKMNLECVALLYLVFARPADADAACVQPGQARQTLSQAVA